MVICFRQYKTHKEALKEAGLKWAHARKLWIYVGTECRGRGNKDMDELRAKYGNEKVKTRSKIKKLLNYFLQKSRQNRLFLLKCIISTT